MTAADKNIARELRNHVKRIEPLLGTKGTLKDYFTVYTANLTRNHEDWLKVFQTRLYQVHSVEYCVLLEVVNDVR